MEDARGQDEVRECAIVGEREPEDRRSGYAGSGHPAGHRIPMGDGELDDEVRRERRHREVETFQPERRNAEDHPRERRQDARQRNHHHERKTVAGEPGRRVRADGHERGVPEGDLSGEPRQDVETHRRDDGDRGAVQDVEPVRRAEERQHEEDDEERGEDVPVARGFEDRHVRAVGGVEFAGAHR